MIMDSLDVAAMQERVDRLLDVRRQGVVDEFEDYEEVLDMLWDQEFYPICLRIIEISTKFPSMRVQSAFLRQIVRSIVGHLSNENIAGILESIIFENFCGSSKIKPRILPIGLLEQIKMSQEYDEEVQQPGVR